MPKHLCVLAVVVLIATPCLAHDAKHPEFDDWYKGLRNSKLSTFVNNFPCCSARHCHVTEADIRNGKWRARVGKPEVKFDLVHTTVTWTLSEWQEVPQQAILQVPNPTGSPMICHSAE